MSSDGDDQFKVSSLLVWCSHFEEVIGGLRADDVEVAAILSSYFSHESRSIDS